MAKKKHTDYVDLKTQPIPEGHHLLEVDNLKMFFHTEDGVVKAVNGVSYTLDRGERRRPLSREVAARDERAGDAAHPRQ